MVPNRGKNINIRIYLIGFLTAAAIALFTGCGKDKDVVTITGDKAQGKSVDPDNSSSSPKENNPGENNLAKNNSPQIKSDGQVFDPSGSEGANLITWKGLLMTGDDSIMAFDRARKKLNSQWAELGVEPNNITQLSMMRSQQTGGVGASSIDNLRSSLQGLNIGPNDGCVLHMTSHGSKQGFFLRGQYPLFPADLDRILTDTCGDRPTVVMVSACYSGIFINDAMKKPNRIILTAARADRTSFGCSAEAEYTYWDSCLIDSFEDVISRGNQSWQGLYTDVKSCIEQKEAGYVTPSLPQAFFGEEVKELKILDKNQG